MRVRAIVWFVAVALAPPALPQTQTATLRGVIADPSGSVIPVVAVVLTNVDQDRPWTVATNDAGEYVFLQIPPGRYSLTVAESGFKKFERAGLVLQVATISELDGRKMPVWTTDLAASIAVP